MNDTKQELVQLKEEIVAATVEPSLLRVQDFEDQRERLNTISSDI